jgi:hypothetical protein
MMLPVIATAKACQTDIPITAIRPPYPGEVKNTVNHTHPESGIGPPRPGPVFYGSRKQIGDLLANQDPGGLQGLQTTYQFILLIFHNLLQVYNLLKVGIIVLLKTSTFINCLLQSCSANGVNPVNYSKL